MKSAFLIAEQPKTGFYVQAHLLLFN